MNLSRFKLITFDVTGTILKFRNSPGIQYGEISALYGFECDKEQLTKNFKEQWKRMTKEHPNFGRTSGIGWERWWKIVVFGTFANMRIEEPKLDEIANHLIDCYKTMACWEQSYGALGLISFLKNRNIPLGIISNFDERLYDTLKSAHLRHYFKFVLTSYAAGFEKPDSRIFEQAMQMAEIKELKPGDCLHIGDTVEGDFAGARKAGWNALLVTENKLEDIQKTYTYINENDIIKNLYELHTSLTAEEAVKSEN